MSSSNKNIYEQSLKQFKLTKKKSERNSCHSQMQMLHMKNVGRSSRIETTTSNGFTRENLQKKRKELAHAYQMRSNMKNMVNSFADRPITDSTSPQKKKSHQRVISLLGSNKWFAGTGPPSNRLYENSIETASGLEK